MNKYKLTLVLILTSLFCSKLSAQVYKQDESKTLKFFKIQDYTVEKDKKIQREFSQNNSYKIIYSCISAGILVFELSNDLNEKNSIDKRLIKLISNLKFIELENYSLVQAEEACALIRTEKQSNN